MYRICVCRATPNTQSWATQSCHGWSSAVHQECANRAYTRAVSRNLPMGDPFTTNNASCLPNHLGFSAIIMNGTLAPAPLAIDGSFFPFSCGAVSGAYYLLQYHQSFYTFADLGSTKPIRAILCYFRLSSHLVLPGSRTKERKNHFRAGTLFVGCPVTDGMLSLACFYFFFSPPEHRSSICRHFSLCLTV